MNLVTALLALALSAIGQAVSDDSTAGRERFDRYIELPRLVRGGRVTARWLDDGSSFTYRDGRRRMFVDPAEGAPRESTRAERRRERDEPRRQLGSRVYAPDGERCVALEDGDLWLYAPGADEGLRLTDDAGEDVVWRVEPEGWSSDGGRLLAMRLDLTGVHRVPIVDFARAEETVRRVPYVKTGTTFAEVGLALFDGEDGTRVAVELGAGREVYAFPAGWRAGGAEALVLRMDRQAKRLDLLGVDPASGASRVILTEASETFVGGLDFITGGWRDVFTPVPGADQFLWLSERDGWRHVYLYDYDGNLVRRLTAGQFPVLRVVAVDAERERFFLMANAEERLYDTHLYRVPLAGGELARLTEATGEHEVQLAPSKLWFIDVHSSAGRPPRSELRDVDGRLVCALAQADVSGLEALGWRPPEEFAATAADGETELRGVLYLPAGFDPGARYPVIDFIYSGPFTTMAPNELPPRSRLALLAQATAQHGYVTFIVDPRGTTERGKAFQDASYRRIGTIEIPDHVATLRQLAAARPYMDLERVGVFGFSWGGYFALRAMLTAPEVFHAGVAGAPGDLTEAAPINEPYMGLPANNPEGYAAGSNPPLAANLRGALLLLHGTADVNAPFSTTMRMVDALVKAGKLHELCVLPGATHHFDGADQRYAYRRIQTFFAEHLQVR